jgi:beta-carotene 3-hydroxylase
MQVLWSVLIFAGMAIYMEYVAWFTHKYVMHGFLWVLHEDHHRPTHRGLQKNDLFAVFFSLVSFVVIYSGLRWRWLPLTSAGFGIALYGLGYVLFHDIMFHRRIPGLRIKPRGQYLQRIVRAHKIHHQHNDQHNSISFGFLYAPRRIPGAR